MLVDDDDDDGNGNDDDGERGSCLNEILLLFVVAVIAVAFCCVYILHRDRAVDFLDTACVKERARGYASERQYVTLYS